MELRPGEDRNPIPKNYCGLICRRRTKRYLRGEMRSGRGARSPWGDESPVHLFDSQQPGGCEKGENEAGNWCLSRIRGCRIVLREIPGVRRYCFCRPRVDGRACSRLIPCDLGLHGAGKRQKTQQKCNGSVPVRPQCGWETWHAKILARASLSGLQPASFNRT